MACAITFFSLCLDEAVQLQVLRPAVWNSCLAVWNFSWKVSVWWWHWQRDSISLWKPKIPLLLPLLPEVGWYFAFEYCLLNLTPLGHSEVTLFLYQYLFLCLQFRLIYLGDAIGHANAYFWPLCNTTGTIRLHINEECAFIMLTSLSHVCNGKDALLCISNSAWCFEDKNISNFSKKMACFKLVFNCC